jgi:hypothetical protein
MADALAVEIQRRSEPLPQKLTNGEVLLLCQRRRPATSNRALLGDSFALPAVAIDVGVGAIRLHQWFTPIKVLWIGVG